jgi:hypothetical protein
VGEPLSRLTGGGHSGTVTVAATAVRSIIPSEEWFNMNTLAGREGVK